MVTRWPAMVYEQAHNGLWPATVACKRGERARCVEKAMIVID